MAGYKTSAPPPLVLSCIFLPPLITSSPCPCILVDLLVPKVYKAFLSPFKNLTATIGQGSDSTPPPQVKSSSSSSTSPPTRSKSASMGSGQSAPQEDKPKPTHVNAHTSLQADTYSLIFNVGAGAGIVMIIGVLALILLRILCPKLFTGMCDRSKYKDLYERIRNRDRERDKEEREEPRSRRSRSRDDATYSNPLKFLSALPLLQQFMQPPAPQVVQMQPMHAPMLAPYPAAPPPAMTTFGHFPPPPPQYRAPPHQEDRFEEINEEPIVRHPPIPPRSSSRL